MAIAVTCSVVLLILTGAAVVVVAGVLVGLRVRRKGQTARDSAVHYYSIPGLGHATVDGQGEGRKKESATTDYYVNEDLGPGSGGGGELVDYYEDMGQGGGGEGRKKESATTDYYVNEDLGPGSGGGEVVVNTACGTVYEELQQSGLSSEHVYSTCKREGALDGVEYSGGASRPDKQPTKRVPGREQHYTALNMDTVNKSEYEILHKM